MGSLLAVLGAAAPVLGMLWITWSLAVEDDLAQGLEIAVVAEGIEREAQADYLRKRGVQFAQGWLFAISLPAAEFLRYIAEIRRPLKTPAGL